MNRQHPLLIAAALFLAGGSVAAGQDGTASTGGRKALLICGLAGDEAHRTLFGETLEKIYAGLTSHHDFRPENVLVVWSEPKSPADGPALAASRGPATRETLMKAAEEIVAGLQPPDALWVFVLGHAHFDGKNSWLNLPGPDMNQADFAALFTGAACQQQVFFMTTAASGFFIKPLSKPGRIVISATEADREVNETIFPHKLAATLAEPPPYLEFDQDADGRLSLFDLYLSSARATAQDYATEMLLATEHAQLDDNGDGRGTELQAGFLPEELGGRLTSERKLPVIISGEGALAKRLPIFYPPSPPLPPLPGDED
jgi:hypothetical protein